MRNPPGRDSSRKGGVFRNHGWGWRTLSSWVSGIGLLLRNGGECIAHRDFACVRSCRDGYGEGDLKLLDEAERILACAAVVNGGGTGNRGCTGVHADGHWQADAWAGDGPCQALFAEVDDGQV